jgi:hypothetical protein
MEFSFSGDIAMPRLRFIPRASFTYSWQHVPRETHARVRLQGGIEVMPGHCQLNGSQPDMTTTYCGHDFFEYPILYKFTFSYASVDNASRKRKQNRKSSHTAWLMISTGKRGFLYVVVAAGVLIRQLCPTAWLPHQLTIPWADARYSHASLSSMRQIRSYTTETAWTGISLRVIMCKPLRPRGVGGTRAENPPR